MTPEKLAENLRETCEGADPIELSSMTDQQIIINYITCSCCGERMIESDTDLEFIILQSNNREDFDRNLFLHVWGGPFDAQEKAMVRDSMMGLTRALLLRLGINRQLGSIRDESIGQEVYRNLAKYLSEYICDCVKEGFSNFDANYQQKGDNNGN